MGKGLWGVDTTARKAKAIFDKIVVLSPRAAFQIPYLPIAFCLTEIKIKASTKLIFSLEGNFNLMLYMLQDSSHSKKIFKVLARSIKLRHILAQSPF